MIGFTSRDALHRGISTGTLFMIANVVYTIYSQNTGFESGWFEPFRFGLFTLGGTVTFLGGLIFVSSYNCRRWSVCGNLEYWQRQIYYFGCLSTFFIIGTLYNITALTNTAGTFVVLYGMKSMQNLHTLKTNTFGCSPLLEVLEVFGLVCG